MKQLIFIVMIAMSIRWPWCCIEKVGNEYLLCLAGDNFYLSVKKAAVENENRILLNATFAAVLNYNILSMCL